jgi:hypothetical protein
MTAHETEREPYANRPRPFWGAIYRVRALPLLRMLLLVMALPQEKDRSSTNPLFSFLVYFFPFLLSLSLVSIPSRPSRPAVLRLSGRRHFLARAAALRRAKNHNHYHAKFPLASLFPSLPPSPTPSIHGACQSLFPPVSGQSPLLGPFLVFVSSARGCRFVNLILSVANGCAGLTACRSLVHWTPPVHHRPPRRPRRYIRIAVRSRVARPSSRNKKTFVLILRSRVLCGFQ